jgi:hypothetical protein
MFYLLQTILTMENNKPTLVNQGMKFGLIMGFIQIAIYTLLYIIDKNLLVDFAVLGVIFVINVALMVWPVRNYKKLNGGTITFKDAFVICLVTIAGGTLLGIVFNYFLYNVIDPGLADFIKERVMEKTVAFMEKMGTPQEAMEKAMADMEQQDFHMSPSKLGMQYIQAVLFGCIPALIIAAILRTKTKPVDDIQ